MRWIILNDHITMDIITIIVLLILILLFTWLAIRTYGYPHVPVFGGRKKRTQKRKQNDNPDSSDNLDINKDLDKHPASKFETYVRSTMERITGKKFPCVYPGWLKLNGKQLELDGYNKELSIAFECQGPQHTKFSNKADPLYKLYKNRIQNDIAKIDICKQNGIGLIIIDYKVPKYILSRYIRSRIYDIAEDWKSKGMFDKIAKLGILSQKPADYAEVITNVPYIYEHLE
jgi:hypothetical protein